MRTLTTGAQTQADASEAGAFNVLVIERAAGTLYLSDDARDLGGGITTYGCVTSWGTISLPGSAVGTQQDAALMPLGNLTVTLHLADATLRGIFLGASPPVGDQCKVYQFWSTGSLTWPDDAVLLYDGTLGGITGGQAQGFSDKDVTVRLRLTDRLKALLDKDVGTIADSDTFSNMLREHEGRRIPLVYGRARKVKAVCLKGPKRGRLMRAVESDATTLYIEGGEEFTQGTAVTIRIGYEYIRGTFNGNVFTVTKRGAGPQADGSYLTWTCDGHVTLSDGRKDFTRIQITTPTGIDDEYVGLWLGADVGTQYQAGEVTYKVSAFSPLGTPWIKPENVPHDALQWRQITDYDATNGVVRIALPFLREGVRRLTPDDNFLAIGTQALIPAGATLSVGTIPAPHNSGEDVYEVLDEYVYAVNDARSTSVEAVYFHGLKGEWKTPQDYVDQAYANAGGGVLGLVSTGNAGQIGIGQTTYGNDWNGLLGAVFNDKNRDYQEIPAGLYTVDLNDTSWTGSAITTISFKVLPGMVPYFKPDDLEIHADIVGVYDGTTTPKNPADVIKDVLVNRIGVSSGDLDTASFTQAKADTNWIEFGGAITRQANGAHLVAWLAMQARCRVRFDAGKVSLTYLRNRAGTAVSPELDNTLEAEDTFSAAWDSPGEVVNELNLAYIDKDGEKRDVTITHSASQASYGRKVRSLDMSMVRSANAAKQVGYFWLHRWAWPWQRLRVSGYLPLLPFERDDTVVFHFPEWDIDSVPARIDGIEHRPGTERAIDVITVNAKGFRYLGCSLACEAYCETGCESACQTWCQTGCETTGCESACETSCQAMCQLACESVAEVIDDGPCAACVVGCQVIVVSGDDPGDWADTTGDTACLTCQGSCVASCESGCETACEAAHTTNPCETSCIVNGCESSCQVECQGTCEACELGCVVVCEASCESTCEPSVITAGADCENYCQVSCETSCETAYVTNDCDTACIVGSCEVACEIGTCETSCEVSDQSAGDFRYPCGDGAMSLCVLMEVT